MMGGTVDVVLDLRVPADGQLFVPMHRDEFYRLSEAEDFPRKSEWYDGLCVVTSPSLPHSIAASELMRLLLPLVSDDYFLLIEAGWDAPSGHFIPDLLVCRVDAPSARWLEGAPILAVEVLSPSTRRGDLTRKRELYAADGVAWYWVVDPDAPSVTVFEQRDGELVEVQHIGSGEAAETVGPYALQLSPDELVRRVPRAD
jgi:Uma2 family endonuclease